MQRRANTTYTFGRFHLDAAERRLLRDGQAIPLTPKAFDTLLTLVQNAGHALTKDELMRAVWPDGFVEEVNLAYNISILRKALADGRTGEAYIETVPKLGYRFVAPVRELQNKAQVEASRRTNLPVQLTRFIGREREFAEVAQAVTGQRLVTLVGAAGMGKTRLALEVGAAVVDQFPDGVWFVELAPLADEALVLPVVVAVLGLPEQPGRSLMDALTTFLVEKRLLLILDNCEHLIEACAALSDALLHACPHLKILATSRESLALIGETLWMVTPLSLPPKTKTEITAEQLLAQSESVQLFCERAGAVSSGFDLTNDNADAVSQICRRLDGMPLAIELAAAHMTTLPVRQIAARLSERFNLLIRGHRTAPPRHQTLRNVINWSYDLLSPAEQRVLAHLSVFVGGWTRGDAESVCVGPDASGLLDQLVQKSLVVCELHEDHARYRLLETIRDYAAGNLNQMSDEEKEALGRRYLAHYVHLAERAWPQLRVEHIAWLNRIEFERDNFCSAIDWALRCNDVESAQRLAGGLGEFWRMRSHWREAREQLQKVLVHPGSIKRTSLRAKTLIFAGIVEWMHDGDSHSLLVEALDIATELNDKENMAHALVRLGNEAWRRRDFDLERSYYLSALTLYREMGDERLLPGLIELLADNYLETSQLDLAQSFYKETIRLRTKLGETNDVGAAWTLRGLGQIALARGDHKQAHKLFSDGFKQIIETGYVWVIAVFISRFAGLAAAQGDMRRAARLFGAEDGLQASEGATPSPVADASEDHERTCARAALGDAEFEAAYAAGQRMTLEQAVEYALEEAS